MASGPKPQWVNFSDLSFAVADALYIGVCVDVLLVCVCVLEKIKICLKKKIIKISLFLFIYIIFFFSFRMADQACAIYYCYSRQDK